MGRLTTKDFVEKVEDLLAFLLPSYVDEGKTNLVIAVGCTGGHHRSVAVTHVLAEHIRQQGYHVTEAHRDISRTSLLWSRYTNREEWDKLEQFRVHRLYEHIDALLGDRGLWRNPGTPNDAWESRWINERKIAILHTICSCTPDAEHPVSGDGEVDFFAADRVWLGIRHACYLASTGEEEDAFVYLEDAVSLAEHVFALPNETEIGCGCKSFAGLTLYLHNERANPTDENSSRLAQFRNYSRVEESGIGYYGTPLFANGIYNSSRLAQFRRYYGKESGIGYYGTPLFANGIYNALTAEHGWEWFDPIRDDTRYPAYIERIRALL